ncbi:MAG: hypothetical protein ACERLB_13730, partial [Gammaproteobacteria bacterium]
SNPGGLTQYGIAAVIIAPGAVINRNGVSQDRSVANGDDPFDYTDGDDTDKDTDPGIDLAANYLDLVAGTEDNASFINSTTNGFILGPVPNLTNDQFIVITAAEVIEMAEKATLQAYQTAINDYLAQTGNVYPWLYNYAVPASEAISSYYPVDSVWATELANNLNPGNVGRVPTIFGDYFTEAGSPPFETKLGGSLSLDGLSTVGGFPFLDGPALDYQTANKLTGVSFTDIADVVGKDGRLTGTMTTPETFTYEVYFWEYDHDEPYMGGWSVCGDDGDDIPEVTDCNRNGLLMPTPGVANDRRLDIIRLTISFTLSGVVNFDMDYTNPPVISPPVAATGTSHASITGTYADVISRPSLTATWERYEHYHEGESVFVTSGAGTSNGTWTAAEMDNFNNGPLSLELCYYPELPDWVFDNEWHDSVMMAYASDYRPDVNGAAGDCVTNPPCLQINGLGGINNDKVSILVIAGEHGWVDGDTSPAVAPDGFFTNDVGDVFNLEDSNLDTIFDFRTVEDTAAPGDTLRDKILVIE